MAHSPGNPRGTQPLTDASDPFATIPAKNPRGQQPLTDARDILDILSKAAESAKKGASSVGPAGVESFGTFFNPPPGRGAILPIQKTAPGKSKSEFDFMGRRNLEFAMPRITPVLDTVGLTTVGGAFNTAGKVLGAGGLLSKTPAQGFFSPVERAIAAGPETGTADQFSALLNKQAGASKEAKDSEFDKFLEANRGSSESFSREVMKDQFRKTQIQVGEIWTRTPSASNNFSVGNDFQLDDSLPRHARYQLRGGENYRVLELQLTNPTQRDFMFPEHSDFNNIVAHIRMNDRVTNQGRTTLFGEEFQSDWHQTARDVRKAEIKRLVKTGLSKEEAAKKVPEDFGYIDAAEANRNDELKNTINEQLRALMSERRQLSIEHDAIARQENVDGDALQSLLTRDHEITGVINNLQNEFADRFPVIGPDKQQVPDAPFKKNWHEMAFKRFLKEAVDTGKDSITWTTGKTQVNRYSEGLRDQVGIIRWEKTEDGIHIRGEQPVEKIDESLAQLDEDYRNAFGDDGRPIDLEEIAEFEAVRDEATLRHLKPLFIVDTTIKETALSDAIAKRYADVIIKSDKQSGFIIPTEGDNVITVDNTGMAEFYDRVLRNFANKVGKKFGARAELSTIDIPKNPESIADVRNREKIQEGIWEMVITDDLRKAVNEGQPLYSSPAGGATQVDEELPNVNELRVLDDMQQRINRGDII